MTHPIRVLLAVLAMHLGLLTAAPVLAGQADLDLLSSYVGSWVGQGVLVGGSKPEPFGCRLTIAKGTQSKINYSGRCTLVSTNLSVNGTIAYNDAARRYEAAMSSNAGFTGVAVGRQRGSDIAFDLQEQKKDQGGSDVRIGAAIILTGGTIRVDFSVDFNNSGHPSTASVPFSRE